MNQNYNNFNGYNQGYNNGYNNGYDNQNNGNNNNNQNNEGGGFFSVLLAIVALCALVYFLLTLLGYDVKGYVMEFINKDTETKEEKKEDPIEVEKVTKIKVKDTLKGYCKEVDKDGNYLLSELKEKEFLNGVMSYCEENVCYYANNNEEDKTDDEDKDKDKEEKDSKKENNKDKKVVDFEENVLYSYSCKSDVYTEMPKKDYLRDSRVKAACDETVKNGSYSRTFKDETIVECSDNTCKITVDELAEVIECKSTPEIDES